MEIEKTSEGERKQSSPCFLPLRVAFLAELETSVSTQTGEEERAEGPGMQRARPRNQWSRSAWHGRLVYLP